MAKSGRCRRRRRGRSGAVRPSRRGVDRQCEQAGLGLGRRWRRRENGCGASVLSRLQEKAVCVAVGAARQGADEGGQRRAGASAMQVESNPSGGGAAAQVRTPSERGLGTADSQKRGFRCGTESGPGAPYTRNWHEWVGMT